MTWKLLVYPYEYSNQNNWRQAYPNCSGQMQSPISLTFTQSTILPQKTSQIKLINFGRYMVNPISLINNGHSVDIKIKYTKSNMPAIEGGILPKGKFLLQNIHFHWGANNKVGSEHVINGKAYSLELHLIFSNNKYKDFTQAKKYPDGLAVVALLYKAANFPNCCNTKIDYFLSNLKFIRKSNTQANVNSVNLSLLDFFGQLNKNNYFSYLGSLTTPPCSEVVSWIVYSDILLISTNTMSLFRKLYNERGRLLLDNHRNVQRIGKRKVYYRYAPNYRTNVKN